MFFKFELFFIYLFILFEICSFNIAICSSNDSN